MRARLGIQLQETKFPEKLRVSEVVTLFRSFYPRGLGVAEILTLVGLEEKAGRTLCAPCPEGRSKGYLSGAHWLAIRSCSSWTSPRPDWIRSRRHQTWEIVQGLKARGRTVLLTTHYMEEAARLCDRVAVVDHGKVIALGKPRDLIASLGAEHILEFAVGETDVR